MNINTVADSIETLADQCLFAASAAIAQMQPWDAAKVLDAIDIINACAILAAMLPRQAAAILLTANTDWTEMIFEDMGEPWEDAIRACMLTH